MSEPGDILWRDGSPVIVVVANVEEYEWLMQQYAMRDPDKREGVYPVYSADDAYTLSLALPDDTTWCIRPDGHPSTGVIRFMEQIFGPAKTIAEALGVQNTGYAMSPRALTRAGA